MTSSLKFFSIFLNYRRHYFNRLKFESKNLRKASFCTIATRKNNIKSGKSRILASMIITFPEPHTATEKSHPIFFCLLGSLETICTVVISKN